jgi:superfamily II DNA or RNA helicase
MTENFKPREWQKHGADQCVALARAGADRALIFACPGSGKTFGGLLIANELFRKLKKTKHLIVITSSLAIKSQWIKRAATLGIELREVTSAADLLQRELPLGVHGFIMHYAQVVNMKRSLRVFCEEHLPIVVLDEVHHTAGSGVDKDGNAWGIAVEYACQHASFKICTTGTPFREGNNPIAFVTYNDAGEATANVRYSYEQAIVDGVCRPIEFVFYDGYVEWRTKSGKHTGADFSAQLSKAKSSERLNAALRLAEDGQFPLRMLEAAHEKLLEVRSGSGVDATAGALAVAMDIPHAEAIADALEGIVGRRPIIVHSKLDDAQDLINEFRTSDEPWIVGISMLSEGVDIPRLRVGVYASHIRTALYFHQFCGRLMRVQESRRERSFVFLPRDPEIEAIAIEIEKERYHALGEEPPVREQGTGSRPGKRGEIEVISSDAERVTSVFNGIEFPQNYLSEHAEAVSEFRKKNPTEKDRPDVEILKWMIDLGVIASPSRNAA